MHIHVTGCMGPDVMSRTQSGVPTLTLETLVHESIQERATLVTESGAGVGVETKPVLGLLPLELRRKDNW